MGRRRSGWFEISIPTSGAPSLPRQVTELLLADSSKSRLAGLAARSCRIATVTADDPAESRGGGSLRGGDVVAVETHAPRRGSRLGRRP
jgi:hypothetical protein